MRTSCASGNEQECQFPFSETQIIPITSLAAIVSDLGEKRRKRTRTSASAPVYFFRSKPLFFSLKIKEMDLLNKGKAFELFWPGEESWRCHSRLLFFLLLISF